MNSQQRGGQGSLIRMSVPHEDRSVSEANRLVFNSIQEGEDHEAGAVKALAVIRVLETVQPRARVADIGCHNGVYTAMYARVSGVEAAEGFDVAEKALEVASKRGLHVSLWEAGAEPCPVENGRYDVAIASEVIEHIVNTEFFVGEMRRILKDRGYVILTTPNLYYWLNRLKFVLAKTPWNYPGVSSEFKRDRNINTEHIRVNGVKEWSSFFEARGFEIVRVEGLAWVAPTSLKKRIIRFIDLAVPRNAQCLALFLLQKA